jgi:hypothetical protein
VHALQVVGVKGPNLAGDCLRAQQLIACVPEPLPTSVPQTLRQYAAATGALTSKQLSCLWEPMKAVVAFSHADCSLHGQDQGFECLNTLCPVQAQQACA